jgi:hypothetical protein
MMRKIFFLACFVISDLCMHAQINAVETFIESNPELKKYFVYQSTLRMINQNNDPGFNQLIKNVRKINVYLGKEENTQILAGSFKTMVSDLKNENFEELITAKYETTRLHLMSSETKQKSYYVLTLRDNNDFALMEMDGSLNLEYLQSLQEFDFDKLRDLVFDQKSQKSGSQ